jgi:hypothetical protein
MKERKAAFAVGHGPEGVGPSDDDFDKGALDHSYYLSFEPVPQGARLLHPANLLTLLKRRAVRL